MDALNFTHPRLVCFICSQVVHCLHAVSCWKQFNGLVFPLAKLRVNSPQVWFYLSQWINEHYL